MAFRIILSGSGLLPGNSIYSHIWDDEGDVGRQCRLVYSKWVYAGSLT